MAHPPKADNHISMTTEVSDLLSPAALDTSSQALGSSTPKQPVSAALGAPLSPRLEDTSKPVDISSQISLWVVMPDDAEPIDQTLKEICTLTTPPAETPGPGTGILPKNMVQLQKEINKVLEHLLMTRSSPDTPRRKQVSAFEMALCQNKSEATEAIREAKALCGSTIRESEVLHTTLIREAVAQYATLIREAKPTVPLLLQRQKSAVPLLLRRQSPSVPNMPAPSNNHMQRAYNIWRWKP